MLALFSVAGRGPASPHASIGEQTIDCDRARTKYFLSPERATMGVRLSGQP